MESERTMQTPSQTNGDTNTHPQQGTPEEMKFEASEQASVIFRFLKRHNLDDKISLTEIKNDNGDVLDMCLSVDLIDIQNELSGKLGFGKRLFYTTVLNFIVAKILLSHKEILLLISMFSLPIVAYYMY